MGFRVHFRHDAGHGVFLVQQFAGQGGGRQLGVRFDSPLVALALADDICPFFGSMSFGLRFYGHFCKKNSVRPFSAEFGLRFLIYTPVSISGFILGS